MSVNPARLDSRAMAALAKQPLADLLDAVAAPTPAPGGGSSAGIACALAAALVEMAAGIGDAVGTDAARARALRARALELAEQELSSYAPVPAEIDHQRRACRRGGRDREGPRRVPREALLAAVGRGPERKRQAPRVLHEARRRFLQVLTRR